MSGLPVKIPGHHCSKLTWKMLKHCTVSIKELSLKKWYNSTFSRLFFDACDGIFLNYNWSQAHLMQSARMARRNRRADVYVGVDTFGRGCYGGGGYNCNKVSWIGILRCIYAGLYPRHRSMYDFCLQARAYLRFLSIPSISLSPLPWTPHPPTAFCFLAVLHPH